MSPRQRNGFTIIEMLVALGVGLVVLQVAFTTFFFTQKFIRRIDRLDAANQVAQAAILWSMARPTKIANFPVGAMYSGVGVAAVVAVDADKRWIPVIHYHATDVLFPDSKIVIPVQDP